MVHHLVGYGLSMPCLTVVSEMKQGANSPGWSIPFCAWRQWKRRGSLRASESSLRGTWYSEGMSRGPMKPSILDHLRDFTVLGCTGMIHCWVTISWDFNQEKLWWYMMTIMITAILVIMIMLLKRPQSTIEIWIGNWITVACCHIQYTT